MQLKVFGLMVELNNLRTLLKQHRWLTKGIAYSRLGRTIRYEHSDVLTFMDGNRVEPEAA